MAADLHIHVGPMPIKPAENSVHFLLNGAYDIDFDKHMVDSKAGIIEDIWVGEVSWLKAALFEDGDRNFIPPFVKVVSETFPSVYSGKSIEITEELISGLMTKMGIAATLKDETQYDLGDPENILMWLTARKGKQAWTVSW